MRKILSNHYFCVTMYLMKETSYNKMGTFSFAMLKLGGHLSHRLKCHFFISITIIVKRDKMIVM